MTVKYYNLKIGSPDVMGGVIKVDTSLGYGEMLEDYYGKDGRESYRFVHLNGRTFSVTAPNVKTSVCPTPHGKLPVTVEDGRPDRVRVVVRGDGSLHLVTKKKGVFLEEITERAARNLKEGKINWDMQVGWLVD